MCALALMDLRTAARRNCVSVKTLLCWQKRGLPVWQVQRGGKRLICQDDLDQFIRASLRVRQLIDPAVTRFLSELKGAK